MNKKLMRGAGWITVALLLWPWTARPAIQPVSTASRWLGPIASLAASVNWIRFDLAVRDGRREHAYVVAEQALALAPEAAAGWATLARHLIFDRASPESEPDPARRRQWIQAGLDTFIRGEALVSDPGALAYMRGTLLIAYVAEIAGDIAWAGGYRGALEEGLQALEDALGHGWEPAGELVPGVRGRLEELGGG